MKRLLTALVFATLVVVQVDVSRAEKLTLKQVNETLRGMKGVSDATTFDEASDRRVKWFHVKNQLETWQKSLKALRAKGHGDETKIKIEGKQVGTLGSMQRELAFRVGYLKAAIANNEKAYARLNQTMDNEWGMLARAAHDFKKMHRRGHHGAESVEYQYLDNPHYHDNENWYTQDSRAVGIIIFRDIAQATKRLEYHRNDINKWAKILISRRKQCAVIPMAQAKEIKYNGAKVLVTVEHCGNIWIYAFVDNILLSSSFLPIDPKAGLKHNEEVVFLTSQVRPELPKVMARLYRLIDEVQRHRKLGGAFGTGSNGGNGHTGSGNGGGTPISGSSGASGAGSSGNSLAGVTMGGVGQSKSNSAGGASSGKTGAPGGTTAKDQQALQDAFDQIAPTLDSHDNLTGNPVKQKKANLKKKLDELQDEFNRDPALRNELAKQVKDSVK